jgi:regulator of sigma D
MTSRLDGKIRREKLVSDKSEDLWEDLWVSVKNTAEKLNDYYRQTSLTATRNDHNTVIRVLGSVDLMSRERQSLEIRLKREDKKIVTKHAKNSDVGRSFLFPDSGR